MKVLDSRSYISSVIVALSLAFVTSCATTSSETSVPCEPEIKIVERDRPIPIWPDFSELVDECIEPKVPPAVLAWLDDETKPALDEGLTWAYRSRETWKQCVAERDAAMGVE